MVMINGDVTTLRGFHRYFSSLFLITSAHHQSQVMGYR